MVEPDSVDPILNCAPGSHYDIFVKHQDLFDFPAESLEGDDDQDGQNRDAAEFQDFETFPSEALLGLASGNIGIPATNLSTTLIVPKEEPPHDFAEDTSRRSFLVDHAASLVCGNNQAPSQDSVFNSSNLSSSGVNEISRSSNNLIEVSTNMAQSESSPDFSAARRSRRIASRAVNQSPDNSERGLRKNIASRNKRPLQKKIRELSQLTDVAEVSQLGLQQRSEKRKCTRCGLTETTQWSEGPNGPTPLCNACEIQFRSAMAGLIREEVVLGANMAPYEAIRAVSETEPEMSQSSVCFESHPLANKRMKPPRMTQTTPGSRKCLHCGVVKTPQWREGPMGPRTLCNACGVRYKSGRLCPEYRPANSPTFVPSIHSCMHRQVVEMRRKATNETSFSEEEPTQSLSDAVKEATIVEAKSSVSSSDARKQIVMNGRETPILQPDVAGEASIVEAGTSMLVDSPSNAAKAHAITEPLISLPEAVEKVAMADISAPVSQYGGSVSEFIQGAIRVMRTLEKVKKLKKKLSKLLGKGGVRKKSSRRSTWSRKCLRCETTETPQWRNGPRGPNTLCNRCGMRYRYSRSLREDRPSSSQQKVAEEANIAGAEPSMPVNSPFKAPREVVLGLAAEPLISPPKDVEKIAVAGTEAPMSQCAGSEVKRVLKKQKKLKKKLPKLSAKGGVKINLSQGSTMPRKCLHCESKNTPQWRDGPLGPKTLCNACGIRFRSGGLLPEYRPAASPAFVPSLHSNSHRDVIQMRKKDTNEEAMVGTVTSSVDQEAAVAKMEPQTPPPPEFTPTNSYSVNSESGDVCSFS